MTSLSQNSKRSLKTMPSLDDILKYRTSWTFRRVVPAEMLGWDRNSELIAYADKLAQAINSQLDREVLPAPHQPGSSIIANFQGEPSLLVSWNDAENFGEIMVTTTEKSLCTQLSTLADQVVPHATVSELLQSVQTAEGGAQAERALMKLFHAADNGDDYNEEVSQAILVAWNERPDTFRREMIWAISGLMAYWHDIIPMLERSMSAGLPWDLESSVQTIFQLVQIELDEAEDEAGY